jgi:membrane associated rhomboid family serine protease
MTYNELPLTIYLIGANIIMSIIGFYNPGFMNKTIMWPYYIKRNQQFYRILTSGFIHADWIHLFFNMFTLFFFGLNLEFILQSKQLGGQSTYLVLYFGAIILSDLPSYWKHKDSYGYRSLGASGAVSAVVFASILFDPWQSIYLYGALKISAALYAVLFVAYCIHMGKKAQDNVNHDAHLWGSIFGLLYMALIIVIKDPALFDNILEQLKHPSLFGNG